MYIITAGGITNIPTSQSASARLMTKQFVTVRKRRVVNTDKMTNVLPIIVTMMRRQKSKTIPNLRHVRQIIVESSKFVLLWKFNEERKIELSFMKSSVAVDEMHEIVYATDADADGDEELWLKVLLPDDTAAAADDVVDDELTCMAAFTPTVASWLIRIDSFVVLDDSIAT